MKRFVPPFISYELGAAATFVVALVTLVAIYRTTISDSLVSPLGDFIHIAWNPGRDLLERGGVDPSYPYPLWTLALLLPLVLLPPTLGGSLWLAINLMLLAGSVAGLFAIFGWPRKLPAVIVVTCLIATYAPVSLAMQMGQTVFASLATLIGITWAMQRGLPLRTGALLGLSLFKPQVIALAAMGALWTSLRLRRWATLLAFGATLALLIAIAAPLAAHPRQIFGGGIGEHLALYLGHTSTLWGLSMTLLWPSPLVPAVACVALGIWTAAAWLRDDSAPRLVYLIALATTVNLLIVPYSWSYNHTMLVLPLGYAAHLALRQEGRARLAWALALTAAYVTPTILHATVVIQQHSDVYPVIGVVIFLPMLIALQRQAERRSRAAGGAASARIGARPAATPRPDA